MPPAVAIDTTPEEAKIPEFEFDDPEFESGGGQDKLIEEEIPDNDEEETGEESPPSSDTSDDTPSEEDTTEDDIKDLEPDQGMKTKSAIMIVSKIGLHAENEDPVEDLDDGEDGKISAR